MDKLEYLQHISQSTRPATAQKKTFPTSLIIKILIGALIALVLIIGLGTLLRNSSQKTSDLERQVYFRTTSLNSTINDYTKLLKSSDLRAIGYSLSGVLTSSASQLSAYITAHSNDKKPSLNPSEKTLAADADIINNFNTTLYNARLNGTLDRAYHTQVQLQVSLLLSLISELIARSKDEELTNILQQSTSNLSVIDDSFKNYSNPSI